MASLSHVITPYTHPGRWTEDEKALFDQGRCCWVIASGRGRIEYCGEPSEEGAPFGYCPEHTDHLFENHQCAGTSPADDVIRPDRSVVRAHLT
jgi:hypothetical protein